MASPTPNKNYTYPAHGGAVNAWDTPLNTNFDFIDLNLGGYYSIVCGSSIAGATFNSTNATISSSITSATLPSSLAENMFYKVSGGLSGNLSLVFPAAGGFYGINNASSNAFSLTVTTASSIAVGYTVPQGGISFCMTDGITVFTDTNKANASIIPITYSEMQTVTASRLLGNPSSIAAIPSEVVIGTGLALTSSDSTIRANVASPPTSSYTNLVIKVTTNTALTGSADWITMTDGSTFVTKALGLSTLDFTTVGVVNGLDAGAIAAATWYYIFAIYNSTSGTVGVLASTSATAPTMPAGYTFKARIGAVTTATASAQLMGTWQFGNRVQYVTGLAQTFSFAFPTIAAGNTTTTASVAALVPPTASVIRFIIHNGGSNSVALSPNANQVGTNIGSGVNSSILGSFVLESTSVVYVGTASGNSASCVGWEDTI